MLAHVNTTAFFIEYFVQYILHHLITDETVLSSSKSVQDTKTLFSKWQQWELWLVPKLSQ